MTARLKTDPRKKLIAKVHIAQGDLALDDGTYRALLRRMTGKDSSAKCTTAELDLVLAEFRRLGWKGDRRPGRRAGDRALAGGPQAAKIRALWLSLYHLGQVRDPSEEALAAYVKRMGRVEALQWLDSGRADDVIKALRGWCERVGFVLPDKLTVDAIDRQRAHAGLEPRGDGFAAKVKLMERLWALLIEAGAMKHGVHAGLTTWLSNQVRQVGWPGYLEPAEADQAIEKLGGWLRRQKAEARSQMSEKEEGR